MKTFALLAAVPALFCLSASIPGSDVSTSTFQPGIYGVCGCAEDAQRAAQVALTINADGTFRFVDASDPARPTDRSGQWELNGRKLTLHAVAANGTKEFTWTTDKNHPCVRPRTGMKFTRLCQLEACK